MNRDEFYTAFKHDIITSKLKPGELLKEKQIMQDYGIGRLPMREIMVRLQQENLIETIPRMGTVVTRLDIKHMRDVVELRLELECVPPPAWRPRIPVPDATPQHRAYA